MHSHSLFIFYKYLDFTVSYLQVGTYLRYLHVCLVQITRPNSKHLYLLYPTTFEKITGREYICTIRYHEVPPIQSHGSKPSRIIWVTREPQCWTPKNMTLLKAVVSAYQEAGMIIRLGVSSYNCSRLVPLVFEPHTMYDISVIPLLGLCLETQTSLYIIIVFITEASLESVITSTTSMTGLSLAVFSGGGPQSHCSKQNCFRLFKMSVM